MWVLSSVVGRNVVYSGSREKEGMIGGRGRNQDGSECWTRQERWQGPHHTGDQP